MNAYRKRFGQRFDNAHRSFLEEELYVIGALGAECLFLHYLNVLNRVKKFAFPYICSTQNTSQVCYDTFRRNSRYAISRACMTATAQYRYMEAYFRYREKKRCS